MLIAGCFQQIRIVELGLEFVHVTQLFNALRCGDEIGSFYNIINCIITLSSGERPRNYCLS